jgi:hypothetical protein
LAKGPVHEAYAEPSEREPTATPVINKEPPKPVEELPPDQKPEGDNIQWMPGYWAFDEDKKDFLWVSGFWRNAPPGRTWVPGSWRKNGDGWQWSGGFWAAPKEGEKKADVEYLPQPPAPLDNAGPTTPAPSESHIYAPGSWVYRDRYVWRPGYWYEHRADWVWTSAHYRWTPAGYVFIDGYWDYPLASRGMLFAPAYIPPVIYSQPAYVYTPTVIVREDCLYGAFFHRRGYGGYYFGDYFAPSYAGLGFTFWSGHVSASISIGGWRDPLFSYYRCGYRSDPFWRTGVYDLCAGRYRGDYMRPPTTLIQQNTVINNITNIKNSNNVNVNNVTMLTSLNQAGNGGRRLQAVSEIERRNQQTQANLTRDAGNRRGTVESELASRPGAGGRTGAPRQATLEVPTRPALKDGVTPKGPSVAGKGGTGLQPPTAPAGPRPTPLGKKDPAVVGGGNGPRPNPGIVGGTEPKGNLKPPVVTKPGPTVRPGDPAVKPDVGATPPVERLNPPTVKPVPKTGGPAANPGPITRPPAASPPSKSVAPPTVKPPVRLPPTTTPKPPAALPQVQREQVAPPRTAPASPPAARPAPPASRPAPKPAGKTKPVAVPNAQPVARATYSQPAPSRVAPVTRPAPQPAAVARPAPKVTKSAPARPAPAKKGKR